MKVLVGCEYSGRVRDAFLARGHDAMSCDLLPTERPGPHYQGDVRDVLGDGWDLAVFHPPCTYLTAAGARFYSVNHPGAGARRERMAEDAALFRDLWNAPIPRVCVENPRMLHEARELIGIGVPSQVIEPHEFGELALKRTCLWLRGLPPLMVTDDYLHLVTTAAVGQRWDLMRMSPSQDRWRERSRTFQGIADAMGEQWG